MPRTRQVKNVPEATEKETECFYEKYKQVYLRQRQLLVEQKEEILQSFRLLSKQDRLEIPVTVGKKTLKGLRQKANWQTFSSASQWSVLGDVGQSIDRETSKKKTSDDGYLTSDSRTDNSGRTRSSSRTTRQTRSTSKTSLLRSSRMSRSLSRNIALENASTLKKPTRKSRSVSRSGQINKYKTPLNTRKLEQFGMVTPKIKPNTTSVILRRPQQGEVAISLQGSPLMTTAVVTETTANVNIPLGDGRMINIQPMKGLRRSEIPDLDPEIQRQLKTLRDNLDKVCQFSNIK